MNNISMDDFEFGIRTSLKHAWQLFKQHYVYFLLLGAIPVVLSLATKGHSLGVWDLLAFLVAIVWLYIALSSALCAVDGKHDRLVFSQLQSHFPSQQVWRQACHYLIHKYGNASKSLFSV